MKIYIVNGTTGEYSDRSSWEVIAYRSKERATKHADDATLWAHRYKESNVEDYFDNYNTKENPFDPHFTIDYTGTDYYVTEVELVEE